jgi:pSer/pThr/pTyr-binding forkhead associated (FHA) protein
MEQPGQEGTLIQKDPRKTGPAGILGSRGVLVVLSGELFGRSAVIERGWTVVGRQEDCDFVLADPMMSRRHFRVGVDEDGFAIEDIGSTNGTTLNAKKLEKRSRLLYGDRVVAGGTILRFFVEEEVEKK